MSETTYQKQAISLMLADIEILDRILEKGAIPDPLPIHVFGRNKTRITEESRCTECGEQFISSQHLLSLAVQTTDLEKQVAGSKKDVEEHEHWKH
jgi:hypothetical protein